MPALPHGPPRGGTLREPPYGLDPFAPRPEVGPDPIDPVELGLSEHADTGAALLTINGRTAEVERPVGEDFQSSPRPSRFTEDMSPAASPYRYQSEARPALPLRRFVHDEQQAT